MHLGAHGAPGCQHPAPEHDGAVITAREAGQGGEGTGGGLGTDESGNVVEGCFLGGKYRELGQIHGRS